MTRVAAIRQACNGLPVAIFLALVEKMESGSVAFDPYDLQYGDDSDTSYHHIDDVLESELSVKITKDLDGNVVSGKMYIEEDHLLEPDAFDNITAAKEDYEGHTGNAGVQATHWYHIGGVIIVPYDSIGDFLCQSQSRSGGPIEKIPQTQINWLAQLCSKPDVQDYLLATMVDLVEYAVPHLESRGSRSTDTSMVSNILKAALLHKKHMLFQTVLAKLSSIVSSEWYGWLREWLIRDDGEAKTLERFNTVKNGLSLAMSSHDGLSHKFEAISNLTPLPKDLSPNALPTPEPIIDWARQMIHKFLDGNGPRDATIKDGSSVVNMAMYFEDPILFLTESLVPVFKKQISAPSFRFKVLSHLVVVTIEEKLPSNESMNLYRTMARSLIESQDFTLLRDARVLSAQEKKRTREPWRMGGVGIDLCRVRRELETAITHETLAKFFVSLLKVSTEIYNLTDEFMAKLIKQADKLPVVELSTMWIPFLQCSIEQMGLGSMLLTTPLYQKFFSALVLATLERYLGPEPPRPANWSMAGSKCSCADCERLSAFLAHPTQMSARFPMNKSRRYHLHRNIEAAGIGCAHVTDRSTNPNTMVVTKTTRPEDVILQQWQERRDQCAAKFGKFKVEHLMTLLGPNYAKIERLGPGPAQTPTSQSPVVGEKRTAATALEIIDLTED
ncbi:hypothetical protein NXS19_012541 [Fusarium pseudograminearum]|nr:hypothetical protein NXS19_012541 [Fusarium pseudograminearum]